MRIATHLQDNRPAIVTAGISRTLGVTIVLLALSVSVSAVAADGRRVDRRQAVVLDGRYHHDHYYPALGHTQLALPRESIFIRFRQDPYYFSNGAWYRPFGARFVAVAPPFGAVLPFLPAYYTTVWYAGAPYYYANDVYYQWLPEKHGYVVTPPPPESNVRTEAPAASTADEPFIYPKNGQSEQQQATDRYACHRAATDQTLFDPTRDGGGVPPDQVRTKRNEYFRSISACLEARGYSVR